MITHDQVKEVIATLVDTYDPLEIYLFGSYAWGHPDDESDLDFLVVIKESSEKTYERPIPGYRALSRHKVPNDLIIYTKVEFEELIEHKSTLAYKIMLNGKKVYAKA